MGYDFRMPNITGNEREQLAQLKSYLYQFIPQLQWALNSLESSSTKAVQQIISKPQTTTASINNANAEATFNSIKALIIKSADIVESYYDIIESRLSSLYVAESDFGTFTESVEQRIKESSTAIEQNFTDIQQIITDIENINFTFAETEAYIKSGKIDEDDAGLPIFGVEIRQKNTVDGEEIFNKCARFTADRLSFYDRNDTEVAYISGYKLYINDVQIIGSFKEGGYKDFVDSAGGIITKWVGGDG